MNLKKKKKIYFYDLSIRNAIIKNWNSIHLRQDVGALWENFLVVERKKYNAYNNIFSNDFFWRTHAQQEIDYLEEYNSILYAYEFNWNPKRKAKWSKSFTQAYPNHQLMKVSLDNYLEFIRQK